MPLSLTQRSTWVKWWIWTSVLFAWAAWIINLSALSALQNDCSEGQLQIKWQNVGELGPIMRCDKMFGYWWWKVTFEWGILVGIMIAMASARVHVFRVMISCFLAIETVLLMDMANTAFFGYYILHHGEDMIRGKCLFSGLIIQCFFNGLLLVGLGTHDEYAAEAEQDYHEALVRWVAICDQATRLERRSAGTGHQTCSAITVAPLDASGKAGALLEQALMKTSEPGKEHRHDPANPRPHTSGNTAASARTGAPAEVDIEIERRSAAEAV